MKPRRLWERLRGRSSNASWTKSPSTAVRLASLLRTVFIWSPLALAFHFLERSVPTRKKDRVLFVLPYREYCENTRFLFEYWVGRGANSSCPLLFVYDKALYEALKRKYPNNVVYARSWHGLTAFLKCRLAFTSRGGIKSNFFPFCFLRRHKVFVNLWHGIPLKRLGWQSRDTWERYFAHEMQRYSVHIVCSESERINIAACYRMNMDDIWVTNVPRNDALFKQKVQPSRPRVNTIIYAPTWRDGSDPVRFFPFPDVDLQRLDRWLSDRNLRLMVRAHLVERKDELLQTSQFEQCKNVFVDTDDSVSLQEKLLNAPLLITDYSSIYLDYLALDRPIIFIPYDLESYDRKRGLLYEYARVTPGPKVSSFAEFMRHLEVAFDDVMRDSESRRAVRDLMHLHQDGNAVERIYLRAMGCLSG